MTLATALLAVEDAAGTGTPFGLFVSVVVIAVLGLVVVRSLRRQREYERRITRQPDGNLGEDAPADRPEPEDPTQLPGPPGS